MRSWLESGFRPRQRRDQILFPPALARRSQFQTGGVQRQLHERHRRGIGIPVAHGLEFGNILHRGIGKVSLAISYQLEQHDRTQRAGADPIFRIGICLPVALRPSQTVAGHDTERVADIGGILHRLRRGSIHIANHLLHARGQSFGLGQGRADDREERTNGRYT